MTARLHLPHPHIAARVAEVFEHALHECLHKPVPVYTDPAAVARWAEWKTPEQWQAEHDGSER